MGLRPLTADGAPCAWTTAADSPALPEALVELSRLEPLIAAMERALNVALEPLGVAEPAPGGLHLRVEWEAGDLRFAAAAAFDPRFAPAPPARPAAVVRLGPAARACTAARLVVEGPSAPAHELRLLAPGDLVLVPGRSGGLRATLSCGSRGAVGTWDPAQGRFTGEDGMDGVTDGGEARTGAGGAGLPGDIPVRLHVELAAFELPLSQVAALAPGAVLAVPVEGDAPAVRITSGGSPVATGRLVALGAGYAVQVDAVELKPAGAAP